MRDWPLTVGLWLLSGVIRVLAWLLGDIADPGQERAHR